MLKDHKSFKRRALRVLSAALSVVLLTALFAMPSAFAEPQTGLIKVTDGESRDYLNNGSTIIDKAAVVRVTPEAGIKYYYLFEGTGNTVDVYYVGDDGEPVGSYFDGSLINGDLVTTLGEIPDSVFGKPVDEAGSYSINIPKPSVAAPVVLKIAAYAGDVMTDVFTHTFTLDLAFEAYIQGGRFAAELSNGTGTSINGKFYLAIYKTDGTLAYVEGSAFSAANGGSASHTFTVNVADYPSSQYTYKAFCWNSDVVPVFAAIDIN